MIFHIAGYKFVQLTQLTDLRQALKDECTALSLLGTILLSEEGININLAGKKESIHAWLSYLKIDTRFSNMQFHQTTIERHPYGKLKVKIKPEIITLRQQGLDAVEQRAPAIAPEILKQWLDEKREIILLDTRNDYEVKFGTFKDAVNLHLQNFSELPNAVSSLDRSKPVVMFCTGGIRCEKAALYMQSNGFSEVYQLDGGILGYFAKVGGAHYTGECFVFDERISVDRQLSASNAIQCKICEGPVNRGFQERPMTVQDTACPACA